MIEEDYYEYYYTNCFIADLLGDSTYCNSFKLCIDCPYRMGDEVLNCVKKCEV